MISQEKSTCHHPITSFYYFNEIMWRQSILVHRHQKVSSSGHIAKRGKVSRHTSREVDSKGLSLSSCQIKPKKFEKRVFVCNLKTGGKGRNEARPVSARDYNLKLNFKCSVYRGARLTILGQKARTKWIGDV